MQLVLQATIGDCLSFDPFAFEEDGLGPSEVDIGRREIGQALVVLRGWRKVDPGRELVTASLFVLLIMALVVWGGWKLISLI